MCHQASNLHQVDASLDYFFKQLNQIVFIAQCLLWTCIEMIKYLPSSLFLYAICQQTHAWWSNCWRDLLHLQEKDISSNNYFQLWVSTIISDLKCELQQKMTTSQKDYKNSAALNTSRFYYFFIAKHAGKTAWG